MAGGEKSTLSQAEKRRQRSVRVAADKAVRDEEGEAKRAEYVAQQKADAAESSSGPSLSKKEQRKLKKTKKAKAKSMARKSVAELEQARVVQLDEVALEEGEEAEDSKEDVQSGRRGERHEGERAARSQPRVDHAHNDMGAIEDARRTAPDGSSYTYQEFHDFYGGDDEWRASAAAPKAASEAPPSAGDGGFDFESAYDSFSCEAGDAAPSIAPPRQLVNASPDRVEEEIPRKATPKDRDAKARTARVDSVEPENAGGGVGGEEGHTSGHGNARIVMNHSTHCDGLLDVLRRYARGRGGGTITPGRLSNMSMSGRNGKVEGVFSLKVQREKTGNNGSGSGGGSGIGGQGGTRWKCVARKGRQTQDVFIVTRGPVDMEELQSALDEAVAPRTQAASRAHAGSVGGTVVRQKDSWLEPNSNAALASKQKDAWKKSHSAAHARTVSQEKKAKDGAATRKQLRKLKSSGAAKEAGFDITAAAQRDKQWIQNGARGSKAHHG